MNTAPVYRAILPRDLVAGLPRQMFFFLIATAVILLLGFQQFWLLPLVLVFYIVMRTLTKRDQYLIETSLTMLTEPNSLEL